MDIPEIDVASYAASGALEDLIKWGADAHHIDLADEGTAVALAADAIMTGAWRNSSELEDIHVGVHKRRGQPKDGLEDWEMMLGNIGTARLIQRHLSTADPDWWLNIEDELFDYDLPYAAGIPLSAHVTKSGLKKHTEQVQQNLWRYHKVEALVGRERFIRGMALASMNETFHGSPLWPTQVDVWASSERTTPKPSPTVIAQLKDDPLQLPEEDVRHAVRTAIGYHRAEPRWHSEQCGNPDHTPPAALQEFLTGFYSMFGMPGTWMMAAFAPN